MTRKPWSHVRILIYRTWAIMPTVARLMESPLIFNPNRSKKGPFLFSLSEPLLTQGLDEPHPSPATFNKTVGSVCVDKKGLLQAYWSLSPCLARELWQVCEWDLIGFGLHNLRIVLCNAKKIKVVLPVNASSSYWILLQCVLCVLRECAEQNHFSYGQSVQIGHMSLLSVDISVFEWWANKIVRNKESIYTSICPVPIQWKGSNLHAVQSVYCYPDTESLLANSLLSSWVIPPLRNLMALEV